MYTPIFMIADMCYEPKPIYHLSHVDGNLYIRDDEDPLYPTRAFLDRIAERLDVRDKDDDALLESMVHGVLKAFGEALKKK